MLTSVSYEVLIAYGDTPVVSNSKTASFTLKRCLVITWLQDWLQVNTEKYSNRDKGLALNSKVDV